MALYGAARASAQERSRKNYEKLPTCWMCWIRNLLSHFLHLKFALYWHWFSKIPLVTAIHHPKKKPDSQSVRVVHFVSVCWFEWTSFSESYTHYATKRQVWWSVCFWLLLSKPVRTLVHGQWRTLLTRNFEFQVGRICPRGKSRHILVMERWLNDFRMGKLVRLWLDGSVKDQRHAAGGFLSLASWICWSPGCSWIETSSTKAFSFKSMLIPFVDF